MDAKTGFFYLFSLVLLFAAFRVVTARNPVHAVLYLMLAFSQASAVWFLLNAEFLAIALVLVDLGAVMVLFMFEVMMQDIDIEKIRHGFWKHFPLAALMGCVVALEMAGVLLGGFRISDMPELPAAADAAQTGLQYSNTQILGKLLYTEYLYPIEIAAVILLVAMVAAIALTLRARKDSKAISASQAVRVKAADRFEMVSVPVTQKAVAPVAATEPAAEEKKA